MKIKFALNYLSAFAVLLTATFVFCGTTMAQDGPETLVVTPTNLRGWSKADTRTGGAVNFVLDTTAPRGSGALQLTTDATTAAKAQFLHLADVPLTEVTDLSYWTKQVSASSPTGDPSYQLAVCLDGYTAPVTTTNPTGCAGFTNFVFEPYWNPTQGLVVTNTWQPWDVDAGLFWSSSTYSSGTCSVVAGAGGPPFYTLSQLQAACPNAVAVGFGVNVGTYNPSYNVETDLVRFNETIYDFEVYSTPTSAEDCKKGGWSTFNPATGPYKNQGQCVSSTNQ